LPVVGAAGRVQGTRPRAEAHLALDDPGEVAGELPRVQPR
jgi:hypothetical protein